MTRRLIRILQRFLNWLRSGDPAAQAARALIAQMAATRLSGERKRSQVFHRLVAQFPDRSKRDLAFLIESLLQESR